MARFRGVGSAGVTDLCVFVAARSVRFRLRRALFGTWCRGTVLPPRFGLSIVLCPICQNLLESRSRPCVWRHALSAHLVDVLATKASFVGHRSSSKASLN